MSAEKELRDYLQQHQTILTIAGNIGLGKTTTAELLARDLGIAGSYELENGVLNKDLLWKFVGASVEEKPEHCYNLQVDLAHQRLEARLKHWRRCSSFVEDRTPEEDPAVLHRLFILHGYLRQEQYVQLRKLWGSLAENVPASRVMLVLQGPAELARKGIEKRGRPEELGGWDLERDLRPLEKYYREFPALAPSYGLHDGQIIEINREKVDPFNYDDRQFLYELILMGLR